MAESTGSRDVCVIGLGNMGSALAEALLANGHRVTVWNRTPSKCEPLLLAGAAGANSISEAINASQVVIVCVTDKAVSDSLLQTAVTAGALRGKLLVQLSTVSADEASDMGRWANENDIAYLVGGILSTPSKIRANAGQTIAYSGPRALFDKNIEVLGGMGGTPVFLGENFGGAANFTLAIYALYYGSMLAYIHGAAICRASGISFGAYIDIGNISESAYRHFGEMIEKQSYDKVSIAPIRVDAAAYEQVSKLTAQLGVDPAVPEMVSGYLNRALAEGHANHELAAIIELMLPADVKGRR